VRFAGIEALRGAREGVQRFLLPPGDPGNVATPEMLRDVDHRPDAG